MEKILDLAALLAAVKCIADFCKPLWKHVRGPIKKASAFIIGKIIDVLEKFKRFLDEDGKDDDASSSNGVTGGVVRIIRI